MSRFIINTPPPVIILPHFELTKVAPICNSNESHSVNSFQMWFPLVKICSLLCYTLVDPLFLGKFNKKRKKKISKHKLIWDLLYFHIITFPWKNIYEGIHLVKSVDIQLATDGWVMKNDRRLGSKNWGNY